MRRRKSSRKERESAEKTSTERREPDRENSRLLKAGSETRQRRKVQRKKVGKKAEPRKATERLDKAEASCSRNADEKSWKEGLTN